MITMTYKGDEYYISQVLKGNVTSFAYIVDRHKDHSFNLALKICGNYEEAEEVAQDAFIKAFRSLKGFKKKSSFSTWLYRIVYNTAISVVRSKRRRTLSLDDFPVDITDFAGTGSNEEEEIEEYRKSLVNFALQKLNEDDRSIITLFYYEDQSVDEISEITGIGKSNVKTRLFRARQKMSEIIRKAEMKNLIYNG